MIGTGCSNDQLVDQASDPQAISFRTQGGTPTLRTTATTTANVDAFVVYGTDNVAGGGSGTLTDLIFNAATVTRVPGSITDPAAFAYSPLKYYSVGAASASYLAYSPVSAKVTVALPTTFIGSPTVLTYTVPVPATTGETSQEDLLVAHTGTTFANTATGEAVALSFQHALARVFVKATSVLNETVTITGLSLKSLKSTGTLSVTPGTTTNLVWTPTAATEINYDYQLAKTGVAVNKSATATLVTSVEQGMMILPQAIGSGGDNIFTLEVTYSVSNLKNQVATIQLNDGFAFLAGKQYAITANFATLDAITFTVTVSDFTDGETYPAEL